LLELADLDQIEAEGLDVGQYPVERGPVQEPPSTPSWARITVPDG